MNFIMLRRSQIAFAAFILCFGARGAFADAKAASPTVYFSPEDDVASRLITLIDHEESQVLVAVYCLTHRGVADALVRAKKRGVNVEVIVDPFSLNSRYTVPKLKQGGIEVSVWDPDMAVPKEGGKVARRKDRRPLMHDKFCVFGDQVVWTGSFNFTYDATRFHRENVIVLQDPEVAKKYQAQFFSIKEEGTLPYSDYMAAHPKPKKNVLDALNRR